MIFCRLRPTLRMIPMAIRLVSRVLPPAVIKGRGNPVMGIMPKVMPTLMMRWKKKMLTAPWLAAFRMCLLPGWQCAAAR